MSAQPLARAFRQIGGMTAVSRILGFFRDVVFAMLLGAGPAADAFLVALKLPNMFRRLTAEGALANAFVPALPRRSGMMATRRPWRSPEKRRRHSRWFLWLS